MRRPGVCAIIPLLSVTVPAPSNAAKDADDRDERRHDEAAGNPDVLFLQQRLTLLGQALKLLILLRDPIRIAILILGTRVRGGLLDELADVVANDGNARVKFGERDWVGVGHSQFPGIELRISSSVAL
jgi:hypothetical protein